MSMAGCETDDASLTREMAVLAMKMEITVLEMAHFLGRGTCLSHAQSPELSAQLEQPILVCGQS